MLNQPSSEFPATGGRGLICCSPDVGGLPLGNSKKKRKPMSFFAKHLPALWQRCAVCPSCQTAYGASSNSLMDMVL